MIRFVPLWRAIAVRDVQRAATVHELALMQSLVETVQEEAPDHRVLNIRLEIGQLAAVIPDALRFCFELCTRDTPLEGATLEVVELPARIACRVCGLQRSVGSMRPVWLGTEICACGAAAFDVIGGEEMRVRQIEIAEREPR